MQASSQTPSLESIKMKRRKHHMKRMGHRQYFTVVKISEIKVA